MSNEIAVRDLAAEKDFAVALAQSDLLPRAYSGKPANVLVAMEWSRALGVPPMVAMQQLAIIDGKPAASAAMIAGLVRRAGHNLRVYGTDQEATCEIVRHDDPEFTFRATWSLARAATAGLAGKGTWKAYPNAMLKARAVTEAARDACPEALLGVQYTPEELERTHPAPPVPAAHDTTPTADADGVILEAELVEESDDDLPNPVQRAYPTRADDDPWAQPRPVHPSEMPDLGSPTTVNAASDKSKRMLWALLRKTGMTEQQTRDWVAAVLTIDPTWSTDDLTQFQVSAVIDRLKANG